MAMDTAVVVLLALGLPLWLFVEEVMRVARLSGARAATNAVVPRPPADSRLRRRAATAMGGGR